MYDQAERGGWDTVVGAQAAELGMCVWIHMCLAATSLLLRQVCPALKAAVRHCDSCCCMQLQGYHTRSMLCLPESETSSSPALRFASLWFLAGLSAAAPCDQGVRLAAPGAAAGTAMSASTGCSLGHQSITHSKSASCMCTRQHTMQQLMSASLLLSWRWVCCCW